MNQRLGDIKMRLLGLVIAWIWPCLLSAAQPPAGRPPVDPTHRVHELLNTLRNDPKPDRRENAAFNLKAFPADKFFEIVPALIEALENDSAPAVRRAIVQTLSELQPRSQEVLDVLERVADKDESWRVRQSARWAKRGYKVDAPTPPAAQPPSPVPAPAMPPPLAPPESPKRSWSLFPWLKKKEPPPAPVLGPPEPILAAPPRQPGSK